MRIKQRSIVAPILACFALSGAAGFELSVSAQPAATTQETAGQHFTQGVQFYKDGDYTAAMVEFKRAYEIDPSYPVLYNIGQTSQKLKDYAAALTAFQKYMTEGAKAPDQSHYNKKKDDVAKYIDELKPKIAILTVTVNEAGTEISVDDVVVGNSPIEKAINVNAGRRKISATKSGYEPFQKMIDVGGTDQKTLPIELVLIGGPQRGGGEVEQPHGLSPLPFIGLGVTAVAGITTIALGVKAIGAHDDFNKALNTFSATGNGSQIESARSSAKTFALAADIMGGITGAAGVVTIVLFATMTPSSKSKTEKTDKDKAEKTSLELRVGPGSLGLTGTF